MKDHAAESVNAIAPAIKLVVGHITWCGCMEVIQAGDWCPACGTMVVAR